MIDKLRTSLDHRSLFSAAYNRKLVKRIEVLNKCRDDFMEYSRALLQAEKEVVDAELRAGAPSGSPLFSPCGASGGRPGGQRSS